MALITAGTFGDLSLAPAPEAEADPTVAAIESFAVLAEAARETPADSVRFAVSAEPRGLALKKLHLDPGFQGFIKRLLHASSDVYFLAWGWDLSGQQVQGTSSIFFYPGAIDGGQPSLIPMKGDEGREFLGAGVLLYPQREVTAGLALRLQIWESRKGERDFGETLQKVATEIQRSELNQLLALISAATGVTGATVAMVEGASLELAKVIGTVLKARSDDYVDYYEGYFPASQPWSPPEQAWSAQSSEIVLSRF
jgi:hypothetical protein